MQAPDMPTLRAEALNLLNAGRLAEADRLYWQIFTGGGADQGTRHCFAMLRLRQGRAPEALEILNGVLAELPGNAQLYSDRGVILHQLGRLEEALASLDRALAIAPGLALAHFYRGNVLLEVNNLDQALAAFDSFLSLVPGSDEGWFRRGNALWRLGQADASLGAYDRALAANPRHFGALLNRGMILLGARHYREALASYQAAEALAPEHPFVLDGMAGVVLGLCDFARWPRIQARVIEAVRQGRAAIAPMTFLPFSDDGALRRQCAERAIARQVAQTPPALWNGEIEKRDHQKNDRLCIAYLSADFRQHATAELMAGLFECHDRARFEVSAVSFGEDDGSPMRQRLVKAFDHFDDVAARDDLAVARLLHERQIDIAIDLKGFTAGARPGILAHRPAPLQVSYLGYPGTVGADWMDYIIADATVLPFDQQPFYSETIIHLPHCYQPNDRGRAIAAETPGRKSLGLPEKAFVFASFNASWKISPAMFDLWMRLLKAVPGSVLWLFADNDGAVRNLKVAAAARSVPAKRLVFAPQLDTAAHLARHRQADLFLDTQPYGAHTTASDALWAGLPVVTVMGNAFDGRVASSLLKAVGLPELIAADLADYEKLASSLARDRTRLAALRQRLQENRPRAPLFDTPASCRHLEAAFERMRDIAQAGRKPINFTVPDGGLEKDAAS